MKAVLSYVGLLAVLAVLIALGEIPTVRALFGLVDAHRAQLLTVTLTLTAVGLALMVWGSAVVAVRYGRSMSAEEAKDFAGRPLPLPGQQSYRTGLFRGIARGRKTDQPVEWSFREMKAAWRSGTWWNDADMRRKYLITFGGLVLIVGGLSTLLVLFQPPAARLLIGGTILYAAARTVSSLRGA